MGSLKLYVGMLLATLGILLAAFFLPATGWIFNSVYWMDRTGPVDYGDSPEATLLETRDRSTFGTADRQSLRLYDRNRDVTQLAMKMNSPGALSVAMRAVCQTTTIPKNAVPLSAGRKEMAELQIRICQRARDLEPDNSFWPAMEAAAWHLLGDRSKEDALYHVASMCPIFDDHADYEARLRTSLVESVRGKLGSQQEVNSYSVIMLPHFNTILSLSRHRTGPAPLSTSSAKRSEVARLGLTMAKTSKTVIGYNVGLAIAGAAVSTFDYTREGRTAAYDPENLLTSEQIKSANLPEQKTLLAATEARGLSRRLNTELLNASPSWNSLSDIRPQLSAASLAICMFLTLPVFWIARRLAAWRENEKFDRATVFLPSLAISFVGTMSGAHLRLEAMLYAMLAASAATLIVAVLAVAVKSKGATSALIGLHALAYLGFSLFAIDFASLVFFALLAAATPLLIMWSQGWSERAKSALSWTAWILWTGAVIFGSCAQFMNPEQLLEINRRFEPAQIRISWLTVCAILGGIGAGSVVVRGAKGLWRQAAVVQGVLILAFMSALAYNVSRDKTMASYIPMEQQMLRPYQGEIPPMN